MEASQISMNQSLSLDPSASLGRKPGKIKRRLTIGMSGFVYFLISLLITINAYITQANMLFWGVGLLVGALFVSIYWICLAMRSPVLRRYIPAQASCGEKILIQYSVCFKRQLAPVINAVVYESWGNSLPFLRNNIEKRGPLKESPQRLNARPHAWLVSCTGRQETKLETSIELRKRGLLTFEMIGVSSGFPFAILRMSVILPHLDHIVATPMILPLKSEIFKFLRGDDVHTQISQNRAGQGDEFFGLRPYRQGDRLRTVDWKRSARINNLVIKEMTKSAPPKVIIKLSLSSQTQPVPESLKQSILDMTGKAATEWALFNMREMAITLAASLVQLAIEQGNQVGLIIDEQGANSSDETQGGLNGISPGLGDKHRQRIMNALALFDSPEHVEHQPELELFRNGFQRPTVVVTDTKRSGDTESIIQLSAYDLHSMLRQPEPFKAQPQDSLSHDAKAKANARGAT